MKITFINKQLAFLLITCTLILFTSCKLGIKIYYGIKKPKIENEKSIVNFAKKKGLDTDNIYCFSKNDWIWSVEDAKFAKNIPDIVVFDKTGKMIKYKEESQCNAKAFNFILSLKKDSSFEYDTLLVFQDISLKLNSLKGSNANIEQNETTDYYIFIFWTVYTGRLNKDHVREWEKDAKNNSNCRINVIKVNMDRQEWWDKRNQ